MRQFSTRKWPYSSRIFVQFPNSDHLVFISPLKPCLTVCQEVILMSKTVSLILVMFSPTMICICANLDMNATDVFLYL